MSGIFNEFLYRPMVNALVFLYESVTFGNLGVAIILLTVIIRIILFPIFYKTAKHQRVAQELQPHIKRIQEKHKDSKADQTKAMMDLYREHKINPLTPIGLIIIQIPIIYALYLVFSESFSDKALSEKAISALYSFTAIPETINYLFLGIDLRTTNLAVVFLSTIAQYIQGKLSMIKPSGGNKDLGQAAAIGKQMMYIGPILTLTILWNLPSAIGLYWLSTTVFSIVQQVILNKHMEKHGIAIGK